MSDAPPSRRVPLALAALCVALGACTVSFGGRPDACGVYPEGGGPAVIATRDQELCEVVRLRVLQRLDGSVQLPPQALDALGEASLAWERRSTVEDLIAAVRRDAGDRLADDVARAIESVTSRSKRPLPSGCPDEEKCLVRGAARGARLAVQAARPGAGRPQPGAGGE
jgi:hypothetical protein